MNSSNHCLLQECQQLSVCAHAPAARDDGLTTYPFLRRPILFRESYSRIHQLSQAKRCWQSLCSLSERPICVSTSDALAMTALGLSETVSGLVADGWSDKSMPGRTNPPLLPPDVPPSRMSCRDVFTTFGLVSKLTVNSMKAWGKMLDPSGSSGVSAPLVLATACLSIQI
jgi:hypothetical protein